MMSEGDRLPPGIVVVEQTKSIAADISCVLNWAIWQQRSDYTIFRYLNYDYMTAAQALLIVTMTSNISPYSL